MHDTLHGGHVRAYADLAGCHPRDILDFSANMNPLGPPPWLREEVSARLGELQSYPDPEALALRRAAAAYYGAPLEELAAGNGTGGLLFAGVRGAAQAHGLTRAVVIAPSYAEYGRAAQAAGLEVVELAADPGQDFALPEAALRKALAKPALVCLCTPGNPSGVVVPAATITALAGAFPRSFFLVDEAFADFAFAPGPERLASSRPGNVLALLSLTKVFAVPGLRIGLAAGHPELLAAMAALTPPWEVSTLAQAVGARGLADAEYLERSRQETARLRGELANELAGLGLHVIPGQANFLLARLPQETDLSGETVFRRLLMGWRIAVRRCANFPGLTDDWLRVAVRDGASNARLVEGLADVLAGRRLPAKPDPGRPSQTTRRTRRTPAIMVQGCTSDAGKSVLVAGLCRILLQDGLAPMPFKAQNMSLNSFVTLHGLELGRAQATQAQACRLEPDARMNPVLLKPSSDTGSQVIVLGRPVENMNVGQYVRYKPHLFPTVTQAYDELAAEAGVMVLEGAGSPAEINLKAHDIVNMAMARHAGARVLLAADIDRGGAFAALIGTMECLDEAERSLVGGYVLNKFRGDASLLGTANQALERRTGVPVLGVVPMLRHLGLPEEDSVSFKAGRIFSPPAEPGEAVLDIALIDLPHISNFTDADPLAGEPDVQVRPVSRPEELGTPDMILLPGSKNTIADLAWLRESGLAAAILSRAAGCLVVGLCAGLQMLGRVVRDPLGLESARPELDGLGLLALETELAADKVLTRVEARHLATGMTVHGYEIHHGRSRPMPPLPGTPAVPTPHAPAVPCFVGPDGEPLGFAEDSGTVELGRGVWGSYLHGVFDDDGFRRHLLDELRAAKGLDPLDPLAAARYDIDPALDRLAEHLRAHLDMRAVYRLLGL